MHEEEKDGFVRPDFAPNQNPFAYQTKVEKRKILTDLEITNEIVDNEDSGEEYSFLYWR